MNFPTSVIQIHSIKGMYGICGNDFPSSFTKYHDRVHYSGEIELVKLGSVSQNNWIIGCIRSCFLVVRVANSKHGFVGSIVSIDTVLESRIVAIFLSYMAIF